MKTKYKLPNDVTLIALAYVKGYNRRRKAYNERYNEILYSGGEHYDSYTENGVEHRFYTPHSGFNGSVVETKAIKLEQLSNTADGRKLKAVDKAFEEIGGEIESEEVRKALQKGVWLNCISGRHHPYEKLDMPGVGRKLFYRERQRFLWRIARNDNLV